MKPIYSQLEFLGLLDQRAPAFTAGHPLPLPPPKVITAGWVCAWREALRAAHRPAVIRLLSKQSFSQSCGDQ